MKVEIPPTVRWRHILEYYVFVFALSYGLVGAFFLSGGSFADASWVLFAQASALAPAAVAIGYTRWRLKRGVIAHLTMTPVWRSWLFVSWGLAPLLIVVALGLGLMLPGTYFDSSLQPAVNRTLLSPEQANLLMQFSDKSSLPAVILLIPLGLVLSATTSLIAGCGEEFGWRGFVYTELKPLGYWKNAMITGMLWFVWHVPLLALGYGFPGHPLQGILLMGISCLVFSFIVSYLWEKSSAFAAGLFHGSTESFMLVAIAPVAGGNELTVGMASISWIGALLILMSGLILYDRFISPSPVMFEQSSNSLPRTTGPSQTGE